MEYGAQLKKRGCPGMEYGAQLRKRDAETETGMGIYLFDMITRD